MKLDRDNKKSFAFAIILCLFAAAPAADRTPAKEVRREVAITFDDLPATHGDLQKMVDITQKLLDKVTANKVPAIGFVNESKVDVRGEEAARAALLKTWLDRGLELGNHTYSHVAIDRTPLAEYQRDVIRGEAVIKKLLGERGMKLRYFRHPQLRTGPTPEFKAALDGFLAARGYRVAPVTIDNNDYLFADAYARAKARGDKETVERVVDAYIPYMETMFDFFERLSIDALGYEVKQTLLLHANELNADYFDQLVTMMRRRGYSFISLDEALKDRAYSLPDAQVKTGLSWIHRWMIAKGMTMRPEPREPEFIARLFETRLRR
ncbi:MAG TPA: polysaccharide deacetylase family protein [Blastocatellia bacterium]|jgi:peptidoglycan/xylan/chitin deacetylase (PgdA/CDA1 family)|nr:polysaccharide deacetylase family protein [Blastocatellia bacterium]